MAVNLIVHYDCSVGGLYSRLIENFGAPYLEEVDKLMHMVARDNICDA